MSLFLRYDQRLCTSSSRAKYWKAKLLARNATRLALSFRPTHMSEMLDRGTVRIMRHALAKQFVASTLRVCLKVD